eukprot:c4791_g1_i1 orf=321-500(-)
MMMQARSLHLCTSTPSALRNVAKRSRNPKKASATSHDCLCLPHVLCYELKTLAAARKKP